MATATTTTTVDRNDLRSVESGERLKVIPIEYIVYNPAGKYQTREMA